MGPPAEGAVRQDDKVRERHRQQVDFLALATRLGRRRFLAVRRGAEPARAKFPATALGRGVTIGTFKRQSHHPMACRGPAVSTEARILWRRTPQR